MRDNIHITQLHYPKILTANTVIVDHLFSLFSNQMQLMEKCETLYIPTEATNRNNNATLMSIFYFLYMSLG